MAVEWAIIGVDTGVHWPTTETSVEFDGHQITLRPETNDRAPSVITQCTPPMTLEDGLRVIRKFLSSLSWVHGAPIREAMSMGGSAPFGVGKGQARLINPEFRADYLPAPSSQKARFALALYREALSVNSVAYQFLGFAKILNILYEKSGEQKDWINRNVDLLADHRAKERLAELRKLGVDVGDYLYTSGRCAVAHAYSTPVVDPEEPADNRRMHQDLPLIRALAEHVIERELGIKSARTVWREHLYELGGFRLLLGDEAVSRLKKLQPIDLRTKSPWPRLSIRLRDQPIFHALENLSVKKSFIAQNGGIQLTCESEDRLVQATLFLDFGNERLVFGPEGTVRIKDDGTPTAIRYAIDHTRFRKHYVLNGELEIYDADRDTLLGRCDPYLPVNIDLAGTADNMDRIIAEFETEVQRREQATASAEDKEQQQAAPTDTSST